MILQIYNSVLNDMTANSVLKILTNLKLYRNDIIELKFNYGADAQIIRQNILDIIKSTDIKLILFVWTYLKSHQRTTHISNYFNIKDDINKYNKNIQVLYQCWKLSTNKIFKKVNFYTFLNIL